MTTGAHADKGGYFVPAPSPFPITVSVGLFFLCLGGALLVNGSAAGPWAAAVGAAIVVLGIVAWFGAVIRESRAGLYHKQEARSFRLGMWWFIISEALFFASLFGVLFYERVIAVPWLASFSAHFTPWVGFKAAWPTSGPAGASFHVVNPWGIPALNTLILLISASTVTGGHDLLMKGDRRTATQLVGLTILLGLAFLVMQAREFYDAYTALHLTLHSGVYGATFYILTGFHALHVTIGLVMLSAIFGRLKQGHFGSGDHFGFQAVSWYWHFVDVVWLILFVFVYWL